MILNIIGTSGSGKSTLTRKIMDQYDFKVDLHIEGRKRPIGYVLSNEGNGKPLYVVGHYETACGGCDTIAKKQFDTVYELVREYAEKGHVLYEGLLLTAESNRRIELHKERPGELVLIHLTTSLEQCIESIKLRRAERTGVAPEDQPEKDTLRKNAKSKHVGAESSARKFAEAGGTVFHCDRDQAFATACEVLGLDGVISE